MTTIGIPCALLPAVALRVIDDLCESAYRLDRRRMGAWASFEQLARTATFAGREGYAGIARLAAADWWAAYLGKRCFAVLADQTIFHGRVVSRRHGLAVVCDASGLCREVHPRFIWSTEGWPS